MPRTQTKASAAESEKRAVEAIHRVVEQGAGTVEKINSGEIKLDARFSCFGTLGTFGTFGGCLGSFGSFGCGGGSARSTGTGA